MKIIVTGAAGQLGSALIACTPADMVVVPWTRTSVDLADQSSLAAGLRDAQPDAVINAAAYTAVDRAETEPDAAYAINRDAAGSLAQCAANYGARFIQISTDFVFDGTTGTPRRSGDPTRPLGVYGASKLAGEQAVLKSAPGALIVRTAWVYSTQGANFVKTMLRLMEERPKIHVVEDQIGTPTHAISLARAVWALLQCDVGGIHHYTDAGVASWYDFAVAIQEEALALGILSRAVPILPIRTKEFPTRARRPAYSVLEKAETWALLPATPSHWRKELRLMLSDLKAIT